MNIKKEFILWIIKEGQKRFKTMNGDSKKKRKIRSGKIFTNAFKKNKKRRKLICT